VIIDILSGNKQDDQIEFKTNRVIVLLLFTEFMQNVSFSIFAPFLPIIVTKHGISQRYFGIMFWVYSVSCVIGSPIVGKHLNTYGRRRIMQAGVIVETLPFLGYLLIDYLTPEFTFGICGKYTFLSWFIILRGIQGIGMSMVQTSTFSILTQIYTEDVNFVTSWMETAGGIGLAGGPLIGVVLYELGGITLIFLLLFTISMLIAFSIKIYLPEYKSTTQDSEDESDESDEVTYKQLLSNKGVIFANLWVFLSVTQYTFFDPFLSNYLHENFELSYETSAYFFIVLGIGNIISCLLAPYTLKHISKKRSWIVAAVLLGVCTMMFWDPFHANSHSSLLLLLIALFLAGFVNSYLIIPAMGEMIDSWKQMADQKNTDSDATKILKLEIINDKCSGLYSMSFELGEIVGPLVGNEIYTEAGFSSICNIHGIILIGFGVIYFLTCDKFNVSDTIFSALKNIFRRKRQFATFVDEVIVNESVDASES